MATQMQGNGMMGGAVPIQLGQGQQQGAYGVQMPLGSVFPQQGQPTQQVVQPTGQQVINGNAGQSYGVENLPPMPQQQGQQPYMGQQGNFGLTPQWGAQGQQPQQGYPQQQGQPAWQQPPQTYGVPYQGAAPQSLQNQQGGFQQPQPGVPQMGLNTRLDGPGIPQALRGRTLGEAIQIYSALEGNWAQRNGATQTPAQQSLNQMGQGQPQQQGSAFQGQAQQQGQSANPWTNPGQFFGDLFEQKLEQRLGPVIQHTQQQAVTQAYTVAKGGIADFGGLEGDVMQMLAGADPQTLANPATWIGAADIARGRQVREGRYQPGQQQMGVQQIQVPGQQPQQGWQGNPAMMRAQPAGQPGQMPAYGFFTESPTAPNVSQFGGNGVAGQPSQLDYQAAAKFQMPIQDYMAWKVGVSGQQNGQAFGMGGGR